MKTGKITAKLRDAVPVCLMVNGEEVKRYKNIELPDMLKEVEMTDFHFNVHTDGKITFESTSRDNDNTEYGRKRFQNNFIILSVIKEIFQSSADHTYISYKTTCKGSSSLKNRIVRSRKHSRLRDLKLISDTFDRSDIFFIGILHLLLS